MDAAEPALATRPFQELRPRPSTRRRTGSSAKIVPTTPQGVIDKDGKTKRISPSTPEVDKKEASRPKSTARMTRKPSTTGRPLVPLTERISQDRTGSRGGRRDGEGDRSDVAPDGTSAGREGRQFTVANVGNHGRIYLRPSIRPVHQRYPQPNFTFPITPPGTAGLEMATLDTPKSSAKATEHHESQFTPTPRTSIAMGDLSLLPDPMNATRAPRHRRAMSDSTIHEFNPANETGANGYRVVITKPAQADEERPKTTDDLHGAASPMLDINIPSWRLGTPRFTSRGIPMIRGSSYAPTEDIRSSGASVFHTPDRNLAIPPSSLGSNRPSRLVIPQVRFPRTSQTSSPRIPRQLRSTYISTHLVIEPAMFNDLTFKPACDDRAIVRYSPTGSVTAASAARLVAEITSPNFLDYELISDFFLTFRSFLEPENLLRMLVARLRWALERHDESGMIARVRTFVALRHWVLNYFVDDFVLDYSLRVIFCNLFNDFVDELSQDPKVRKVQFKILTELKKCWRRICAHYWDGPEFDDALGVEVPIAPGGIAGYRDPNLDPSFWEREGIEPPQWDNLFPFQNNTVETANTNQEAPKSTNISDFVVLNNRPGTPENQIITNPGLRNGPTSPLSIASMDIVSCSFPSKNMKPLNPHTSQAMIAHPVYSTSPILPSGAVATTPRALAGKRVRPTQTHKRNNSITDSLREHSSDKSSAHDADFAIAMQSAGSLVRGNLLPPGQPFVDVEPDFQISDANRQTTIFQPQHRNLVKDKASGGAMSGYGMKKLIGSVRRALSSRGQWSSGVHSSLSTGSSVGPRGVTTNRLPGTAVVPQHGTRQKNGARPPVRIDLLGAEIVEDFKKAVREEEAAAEAERLGISPTVPNSAPAIPGPSEYSAAYMESSTFDLLPRNQKARPVSDMGITVGSKSIVIVDDTIPFDMPGLHDRVPTVYSPSVEAFTDSFMPEAGDPTPPNTPPLQNVGGTPRRSSYLLNQHIAPTAEDNESLPPFIPDLSTLGGANSSRPSEELNRHSLAATRRSQRYPPISRGAMRMHRRNQSSKTQPSIYSVRRHASFSSGVFPSSTVRSFDATTDSSIHDRNSDIPVNEPPRMLRRRPGGDLRAARNAGELDGPVIRRSRSVGSLTTYSESIRSSFLVGSHPDQEDHYSAPPVDEYPRDMHERFSVGQLTHKPVKRDLSLFSTHSSKPVMRPSFEIQAKRLAEIPDEEDGGIESALLKLEGKYKPRQRLSHPEDLRFSPYTHGTNEDVQNEVAAGYVAEEQDRLFQQDNRSTTESRDEDLQALSFQMPGASLDTPSVDHLEAVSFLSEASRESYCSIPLLDRGLTDEARSKRATTEWTDRSIFRGSDDGDGSFVTEKEPNSTDPTPHNHMSYDFVEKTNSIQNIEPGETLPPGTREQSFLDDASAAGSDLSSELSVDGQGADNADHTAELFPAPTVPPHPFGDPISAPRPESSVPMTLTQALEMSPERQLYLDQIWIQKPLPLTPEVLPGVPYAEETNASTNPPDTTEALQTDSKQQAPSRHKFSVHLPFILAFDSDILAQQFTLIEKDALNDIDWKELIDMNWKNATSNDSRSWVDFLRNSDAHGVEVVVARFNIMVKWAISEIVLTQNIEERARCIIKYIHIAAHCRRYRNFATLAQLTIGLSSNEIARLSRTWELVPAHDLKTLAELETLVTPTRNFYNLRAEMESGSDRGCIPFVGIYTHDLLYNAQRPSEIASSPTTPPLINFERCRIGAAVVKTLLRLLEASTRYSFQPIEGITERCLWMGALTDDEIRRHSESLE